MVEQRACRAAEVRLVAEQEDDPPLEAHALHGSATSGSRGRPMARRESSTGAFSRQRGRLGGAGLPTSASGGASASPRSSSAASIMRRVFALGSRITIGVRVKLSTRHRLPAPPTDGRAGTRDDHLVVEERQLARSPSGGASPSVAAMPNSARPSRTSSRTTSELRDHQLDRQVALAPLLELHQRRAAARTRRSCGWPPAAPARPRDEARPSAPRPPRPGRAACAPRRTGACPPA